MKLNSFLRDEVIDRGHFSNNFVGEIVAKDVSVVSRRLSTSPLFVPGEDSTLRSKLISRFYHEWLVILFKNY